MRPERRPVRIGGADAIDRVEGERHHQIDADDERHAEPDEAMADKLARAPAQQARPDEKSREEEHQLHQIEKLKRVKQIEAEPALVVDDRHRPPVIGGKIEGRRVSRLVDDVS
jgi:hypothetical protein